jgi:hypothetical protein
LRGKREDWRLEGGLPELRLEDSLELDLEAVTDDVDDIRIIVAFVRVEVIKTADIGHLLAPWLENSLYMGEADGSSMLTGAPFERSQPPERVDSVRPGADVERADGETANSSPWLHRQLKHIHKDKTKQAVRITMIWDMPFMTLI